MPNKEQFNTHEEYLNWYKEYYEKNKERLRLYYREYAKNWRQLYGYHNEKKWKKNNQEKVKVQRLLQHAVKIGIIKRKPCIKCGNSKSQGHHENYLKPLRIIWLCALCHKHRHIKKKKLNCG